MKMNGVGFEELMPAAWLDGKPVGWLSERTNTMYLPPDSPLWDLSDEEWASQMAPITREKT